MKDEGEYNEDRSLEPGDNGLKTPDSRLTTEKDNNGRLI
jgi:hypothetical protein